MMAASDEPDGDVVNGAGGTAIVGGGGEDVKTGSDEGEQGVAVGQNGDEEQPNDENGTNGRGQSICHSRAPNIILNFSHFRRIP